MLRFAKVNKSSRKIILWCKKSKVWDVEVGDIVISKLIEKKNNSKCLIKYLDEVISNIYHPYVCVISVLLCASLCVIVI